MRTMTTATTSGQCFANRVHGRGGMGMASESSASNVRSSLSGTGRRLVVRGAPPPPMEWTYCHPRHQGLGEY